MASSTSAATRLPATFWLNAWGRPPPAVRVTLAYRGSTSSLKVRTTCCGGLARLAPEAGVELRSSLCAAAGTTTPKIARRVRMGIAHNNPKIRNRASRISAG